MSNPLRDSRQGRSRLSLAGRARASSRFRHLSVSQGIVAADSRQRRRVQHVGESLGLFRHAHGGRERDGRLSRRRSDQRARARDGRAAVLQAIQARRRARSEHGDRLQRSRPRRSRAGRVLQPQQRSGRAAEAGRLRLEGDFRERRALVPQRRHLRGAVGDDRGADHRGDAGGEEQRRRRVVRFELPREALERGGRRPQARARRDVAHRRACGRARRQRGGSAERTRHSRARRSRPSRGWTRAPFSR